MRKSRMKGAITIARKYKEVKEKKITFDKAEYEEVERKAKECCTTATAYIRYMAVRGADAYFFNPKDIAPLLNGMRIISSNVNQIAKKVNETHSIYAADVEKLRKEMSELRRMLNTFVSTAQWTKV